MSTHIVGFVPPDEKWIQMKAVFDACMAAKVQVPREVEMFFGGVPPDQAGREVSLEQCIRVYTADSQSGYEVEVFNIPANVKVIRFYNSY